MSDGQSLALRQLHELVEASDGAIELPVRQPFMAETGFLVACVSLDCAGTPHAASGLRLRPRERIIIHVPAGFPHEVPSIQAPHRRWARTPHVQWGSWICLYAAPAIEWVPADGLLGLFDRLRLWLERASLGELDPDGAPLHPPVAYTASDAGCIVVRADIAALGPIVTDAGRRSLGKAGRGAPRAPGQIRFLVGVSEEIRRDRRDVLSWMELDPWRDAVDGGVMAALREDRPISGALAVLTDRELTFEYPRETAAVMEALRDSGIASDDLFRALAVVARGNATLAQRRPPGGSSGQPELYLLVGTPSRRIDDGLLRQHLVCWRIDEFGRLVAEGLSYSDDSMKEAAAFAATAERALPVWIDSSEIHWVEVMEDRSEVTIRRDHSTSATWLSGRRVLVLGGGALGGPIAECCVRAGASTVVIVDSDSVSPGVLVRQPYTDADIGQPKAVALAARLDKIRRDTSVVALVGKAERVAIPESAPPAFDLVVEATADGSLNSVIELRRRNSAQPWPAVISAMIGHDAQRGIVAASVPDATGCTRDVIRRFSLAAREEFSEELADVADDLFPPVPRTELFHPEPGCSSPTFVGSAMQLAALAGGLLDAGIGLLTSSAETGRPMGAVAVRGVGAMTGRFGSTEVRWANDLVVVDEESGYEIRVARSAVEEIRAEVRRGARLRGKKVETGGPLFGQIDDACRCIWIDRVGGPPPDSLLSAFHFDHGTEGVEELARYHRDRSGGQTAFLGMWHSHPFQLPLPSPTDRAAMSAMVMPVNDGPRRAVVLIVGGEECAWSRWTEEGGDPKAFARLTARELDGEAEHAPPTPSEHRTDAWPGGWVGRSDEGRAMRRRHHRWRRPFRRRGRR